MISNQILKTEQSLEDRGLPADSYFEVTFSDGSVLTEKNSNWSSFSTKKAFDYFGNSRDLYVSNYSIKKIRIFLAGMSTVIDAPNDCYVYQFIRSDRLLARDIDSSTIVGRGIGLVKDGSVVEERFISALENRVMGMRK